jgi:hypothetical protein
MNKIQPNIFNTALLWEYDINTFNFDKSYKIVIERILQLGDLDEWKSMVKYYSKEKIIETISWSKQLDKRDKDFSLFFLNSEYFNVT